MEITVGADPELFVSREDSLIPAGVITKGTKEEPLMFGGGYGIHADNVCLEFNIPPAKSRNEFIHHIQVGMDICKDAAPGCKLVILPAQEFTEAQLAMVGAEAMLFHCNPEIKVWGGDEDEHCIGWRVAGGHIHIGAEVPSPEMLAMSCDFHMGLRAVMHEHPTLAAVRRRFYGKAGAFRKKDYGIEYRVLSNFWLRSQELTGKVYDWAQEAVDKVFAVDEYLEFVDPYELCQTINTGDMRRAEALLKELCLAA